MISLKREFAGSAAALVAIFFAVPAMSQISNRLSAEIQYSAAMASSHAAPDNLQLLWEFSRATFDLAEHATNNSERAELADKGIAAARAVIAKEPGSAAAHYYLGMNLGQLARTRFLSALKIVGQIEKEFLKTRELDPKFDFGGPDRNLGLLYKDAPSIGSVGSRRKAQRHMLMAIEQAPTYPENRLNLIEAYLSWGDRNGAVREYKELLGKLEESRKALPREKWSAAWADWDARVQRLGKALKQAPTTLESPHG